MLLLQNAMLFGGASAGGAFKESFLDKSANLLWIRCSGEPMEVLQGHPRMLRLAKYKIEGYGCIP